MAALSGDLSLGGEVCAQIRPRSGKLTIVVVRHKTNHGLHKLFLFGLFGPVASSARCLMLSHVIFWIDMLCHD